VSGIFKVAFESVVDGRAIVARLRGPSECHVIREVPLISRHSKAAAAAELAASLHALLLQFLEYRLLAVRITAGRDGELLMPGDQRFSQNRV
jgi:hypothetical protein